MKISAALALLSFAGIAGIPALAHTVTYTLTTPNPTISAGSTMIFDGTITAAPAMRVTFIFWRTGSSKT